jgi:TonB family protein
VASGSIFICYRREDTIAYAGRLYDRLSSHFGTDRVFMDIDAIQPGEDFVEVLERRVGACDALIAVIGKDWLDSRDVDGRRRLDDPEDYVRREIVAALERKVRVIPALVEGARMPRSSDMPPEISGLARRNAIEITDWAFHVNVTRLIETLEAVIANPSGAGAAPPQPPAVTVAPASPPQSSISTPRLSQRRALFIGGIAAALLLGLANVAYFWRGDDRETPREIAAQPSPPPATVAVQKEPEPVPVPETKPEEVPSTVKPQPSPAAVNVSRTVAPSTVKRAPALTPVRVGGNIKPPTKTKHVAPMYPPIAQSSRVQGVVILETTIGPRGRVSDVRVLRSIPLLDQAAVDAVKQWEYTPTLLNGVGVPVIMTVTVNFALVDDRAVVSKFVDRLQAKGDKGVALEMLRKVFAVNAWGASDAAMFSTLRTNVANATEAQLQLAKSFIPKE